MLANFGETMNFEVLKIYLNKLSWYRALITCTYHILTILNIKLMDTSMLYQYKTILSQIFILIYKAMWDTCVLWFEQFLQCEAIKFPVQIILGIFFFGYCMEFKFKIIVLDGALVFGFLFLVFGFWFLIFGCLTMYNLFLSNGC